MAIFGLFKKDKSGKSPKKGFYNIPVGSVEKVTDDTIKITLTIPDSLSKDFRFLPGQYLNISMEIDGKDERRSYSICSGQDEAVSIAVKSVKNGKISCWLNDELKEESILTVSKPQGNFTLKDNEKNVVAVAAGSGITPILSMAKAIEKSGRRMKLFYGNRTINSIIFRNEIENFKNVHTKHFLTGETKEGFYSGRINKESFTSEIKADLELLKADAFYICGPEQMILDVASTLEFFGVPKSKIHFELFTIPVLMKSEETTVSSNFDGESKVKAILDGEAVEFTLHSKGSTVLDAAERAGLDAPFSCRGGVCCSCKAKILKGSAHMSMNYSLTDKEIHEGYILTCQAHPTSEELTLTFDE